LDLIEKVPVQVWGAIIAAVAGWIGLRISSGYARDQKRTEIHDNDVISFRQEITAAWHKAVADLEEAQQKLFEVQTLLIVEREKHSERVTELERQLSDAKAELARCHARKTDLEREMKRD
jgi:chromosome segregation ATPase